MKIKKVNFGMDWPLVILPLLLALAGVATIYGITLVAGDSSLVRNQVVYLVIAALFYLFFTIIDYRALKPFGWYFYGFGLISLMAVFLGEEVFGSKRWIDLGFFQFQPSELMKFVFLILGAGYFSSARGRLKTSHLIFFLIIVSLPTALVFAQPDLGTALSLLAVCLGIIIAAKIPKKYYLVGLAVFAIAAPFGWKALKPYQKQRLAVFVNPASDPLGAGYNVSQAKIAVGAGGIWGRGFDQATQSQLHFLPVAHVDFVFSGWAEIAGFAGSALMVLAFAVIIWRIFNIAFLARDDFGMIFCLGLGMVVFFQAFVNIGMNIAIAPITGIPLPFVSYGGTSMIVTSAAFGVAQSIYLRRRVIKFE